MYSAPFSEVILTDGIPRQRLPWASAGHARATAFCNSFLMAVPSCPTPSLISMWLPF